MKVGDLVERPWEYPGRIGLLIAQLPKSISTGVTTGDFFVVQWSDGTRDSVRSQFLEVVSASG